MTVVELNRRDTMKLLLAAGGLTISYSGGVFASGTAKYGYLADKMTVPLIKVHSDNHVTIYNPNADMGQGTSTGIPMMIAEELDLNWENITVEQLPLKRHRNDKGQLEHTYVWQGSGGSRSIVRAWEGLRHIAAQGRDMFLRAAATKWGVRPSVLQTQQSFVLNTQTGARISYAELVNAVAELSLNPDVPVKRRESYTLIGRPTQITAGRNIVTGVPMFGIDQAIDDMVHAVISRCPHFSGSLKSVDDRAARAVEGVLDIVHIEQGNPGTPEAWNLVAGVAVIAKTFWAAKKARDLLEIEWNIGSFEGYSSAKTEETCLSFLDEDEGFKVSEIDGQKRNEGDYDKAIKDAKVTHDAKYVVSHVAHALMEPHSAIADVKASSMYLRMPCQHPFRIQDLAYAMTGIKQDNIQVDVVRSGGAFGRRWELDYPAEAIHLSQRLKKPVKVSWTREDELTQDRYRNANHYRMTGGVDSEGKLIAMRQRQSSGYPSLNADTLPPVEWAYDDLMGWHFEPGFVPNHRMEQRFVPSPVPRGPWRAPGSVNSAFAQMSFFDELAHAAGIDPLVFNLSILGEPRVVKYSHHTGRMAECYRLAAKKAGWGKLLPEGHGQGIAGCYSHGSYVVHVIEVSVLGGRLTVEKLTTAADCGLVINPLSVESQIQGCIMDGLSVALGQEITVKNAAVQEANFDSYEMSRIDRTPKEIDIHLIEGAERPTGMGEPAMPPFAPALVNAIFAATGKRIRRLPIADQLTI
ncbi:MAG: molybdopterin cofactor-binding domain-containing protein [Kordiimonas sp.]